MRKALLSVLLLLLLLFSVACDPVQDTPQEQNSSTQAEYTTAGDSTQPESGQDDKDEDKEKYDMQAMSEDEKNYVEGEYIVGFTEDLPKAERMALYSDFLPVEHVDSFELINADLVRIDEEDSDMLMSLEDDPYVEYIEPNYIFQSFSGPITEDDYARHQWAIKNYGQSINNSVGVRGIDINAEEAWQIQKGCSSVIVAVLDTGIDYNHPDLEDSMWRNEDERLDGRDTSGTGYIDDVMGWDFYHHINDVYDNARADSHGTHIAGIIAATKNSGGVAGIAPNVQIMPLKFLGPFGGRTSHVIQGITYATNQGALIVNCSFGGPNFSQALKDAMRYSGLLYVVAAGNSAADIDRWPASYPAAYDLDNIISVSSVNNRGQVSYFSNYGQHTIEVAAPGEHIYSTFPEQRYGYASGTSMATPYVAGIAALVASQGITDPLEIRERVLESARDNPFSTLDNRVITGGMVEAALALGAEPTRPEPKPDPEPAPDPEPDPEPEPEPDPDPEPSPEPPPDPDDPRPGPGDPWEPVERIILEERSIFMYDTEPYQVKATAYPDEDAPLHYNLSGRNASQIARVTDTGRIVPFGDYNLRDGVQLMLSIRADSGVHKTVPVKIEQEYIPVNNFSIIDTMHVNQSTVKFHPGDGGASGPIRATVHHIYPSYATNQDVVIKDADDGIIGIEGDYIIPYKNGTGTFYIYSVCEMENKPDARVHEVRVHVELRDPVIRAYKEAGFHDVGKNMEKD